MSTKQQSQIVRTLVWVGVAAAAVLFMNWDRKQTAQKKKEKLIKKYVFQVDTEHDPRKKEELHELLEKIKEVRFQSTKTKGVVVFGRGEHKEWIITKPFKSPSDVKKVDEFVGDILKVKQVREVSSLGKDKDKLLKKYGLARPKHTIVFVAGKKTHEAHLGNKDPFTGDYFLHVVGSKKITTVEASLFTYLDKKLFDFRLKKMFTQRTNKITTISLTRKKNQLVFEKQFQKGILGKKIFRGWKLTNPINTDASRKKVSSLLSNLKHNLLAKEFVSENQTKDKAKFGLDKPNIIVDVVMTLKKRGKDKKVVEETKKFAIHFSKHKKKYYSLVPGRGPIARIEKSIYTELSRGVGEFRERELVNFKMKYVHGVVTQHGDEKVQLLKITQGKKEHWNVLTSKETSKGDKNKIMKLFRKLRGVKAKDFVEEDANAATLAKYGLDKPTKMFVVQGSKASNVLAALFLGKVDLAKKVAYATNRERKKVFTVGLKDVLLLPTAAWKFIRGGKPPKKVPAKPRTTTPQQPSKPAKNNAQTAPTSRKVLKKVEKTVKKANDAKTGNDSATSKPSVPSKKEGKK